MKEFTTLKRVLDEVKSKKSMFPSAICDFWLHDETVTSLMSEATTNSIEKGKLVLRFMQKDGQIIISIIMNHGICGDDCLLLNSISELCGREKFELVNIYEISKVDIKLKGDVHL